MSERSNVRLFVTMSSLIRASWCLNVNGASLYTVSAATFTLSKRSFMILNLSSKIFPDLSSTSLTLIVKFASI